MFLVVFKRNFMLFIVKPTSSRVLLSWCIKLIFYAHQFWITVIPCDHHQTPLVLVIWRDFTNLFHCCLHLILVTCNWLYWKAYFPYSIIGFFGSTIVNKISPPYLQGSLMLYKLLVALVEIYIDCLFLVWELIIVGNHWARPSGTVNLKHCMVLKV